jgi:dipeptidyl aminopeptidase/acylaminoacyl peptidase
MPTPATLTARTLATVLLAAAPLGAISAQNAVNPDAARPAIASAARPPALKQLDPADLSFWKNIRYTTLSNDGKWFAYQLAPNEGDAEVVVRPTAEGEERRFKIGEPPAPQGFGGGANTSVVLSDDGKWLAFLKYPTAAEAKKLRKDKKPVQSGVVLLNLASGEKRDFEKARRFSFAPKQGTWLAVQRYAPEGSSAGAGADLLLIDLRSGSVTSIGNVGDYAFDDSGSRLAWTVEGRDLVGNGVQLRDLKTDVVRVLDSDKAVYRRLAWADSGVALAVLRGHPDSAASDTSYAVLGFTGVAMKGVSYTPSDTGVFPTGYRIAPDRAPRWAGDRSAIFFGIAPKRPTPESKTPRPDVRPAAGIPGAMQSTARGATDNDDDLATLVIWHAKDPRLQSQQQVEESRDKQFTYLAEYRVADRKFIRLGTEDVRDVSLAPNERWAVGGDIRGYERAGNIDGMRYRDLYVIDTRTGERKLAVKKLPNRELISPDGSKFLYFDDGQYRVYDMAAGSSRVITADAPVSFVDTEDDHNVDRPPVAPVGWAKDGGSVVLSDNWDMWRVPVSGSGKAVNLTGNGRSARMRYQRRVIIDPQERGIDFSKPLYVTVYGERTKKEGLAVVNAAKPGATPLLWEDAKYAFARARDADTWIFTRQTVKEFPDYWVTTAAFASPRRLTNANPQQADYAWSSGARLVDYVTDKGDSLQGALYLPANYEPGKKYPTVVYIYEKRSQFLHSYSVPNETQAFNPSVYTSRGYAVFQPDIVYKVNDPGMSAVWAVVPAVKAAIATGIVDSANIALHGHSWGGYQTAFLVTQTNIFKSAIAGAPLTDMVSMYSSVYWNSGGGNMAIFESSQGRFKGNFLENYDAYIRNSPAFHADKITTPLMILHNEHDGAVDFNQGITFFNTLRELGKDVVLLQYVGENHGLAQPKNMKDYTIRMREYFDHYLKGEPAPDWLKDGIPRLKMEEHLKSRQKKTEKIAS